MDNMLKATSPSEMLENLVPDYDSVNALMRDSSSFDESTTEDFTQMSEIVEQIMVTCSNGENIVYTANLRGNVKDALESKGYSVTLVPDSIPDGYEHFEITW